MKTLASILGAVAVIAIMGCATLWKSLRAERQAGAQLQAQVAAAGIARLEATAAAPPAVVGPPAAAAPVVARAEAPVCTPDAARPAPAAAAAASNSAINLQRQMMNDPEYRKLRTAQNRLNVERSFAGLAEELGLSAGEAARLFDLLAEQQTAQMIDNQLQSANRPQDQAGRDEITRRREALVREQEQAVATMLGSRFTQFREFQESRPARGQVTSLNSQLGQAGLPLTDAQKRSLTSVMFADQQRRTLEARTLAQAPRPNATDPESRVKALEDNLKRSEESSRQLLDAIAPHLTASQLAAYRKQMEDQATANRASVQLQIQQQRLQSRLQAQQGQ